MIYVKIKSANSHHEMRVIDREMEAADWSYSSNLPAIKLNGVYYRYYEKDV